MWAPCHLHRKGLGISARLPPTRCRSKPAQINDEGRSMTPRPHPMTGAEATPSAVPRSARILLATANGCRREPAPFARVRPPQGRGDAEMQPFALGGRCAGMADDTANAPRLTAEQYRELAKLIRQTAAATTSRLRVQGLLDTARLYEELADIADSRKPARSPG